MLDKRKLYNHPIDSKALIVPLTRGFEAVVDKQFANDIGICNWAVEIQPHKVGRHTNYAFTSTSDLVPDRKSNTYLHQYIWYLAGKPHAKVLDHIDGDGLNCRFSNLREASKGQNGINAKLSKRNTSGYRGVSAASFSTWRAYITINKKQIMLGYFATPEEAAVERDIATVYYYGEFARLNFPDTPPSLGAKPTVVKG